MKSITIFLFIIVMNYKRFIRTFKMLSNICKLYVLLFIGTKKQGIPTIISGSFGKYYTYDYFQRNGVSAKYRNKR